MELGLHADLTPGSAHDFCRTRGPGAVAGPVDAEDQRLPAVGHFAHAVAVRIDIAGVVQNLIRLVQVELIILDGIVVPDTEAVGNEGQAWRAEAQENHIDDLLLVGGMGQGQAHIAILERGMARADAIFRRTGLFVGQIEHDVGHAGRAGRTVDDLNVGFVAQGGYRGLGHLGDHIDLTGAQSLDQRVLVVEGLEDCRVHLGRIEGVVLVGLQADELILGVVDQLEDAAAHHLQVFELGRVSRLLGPDVFRQDEEIDELALHVGDRLAQGDDDRLVVSRFDGLEVFCVDVEEGEVGLLFIEVVGEGHIFGRQRFAVRPLKTVTDGEGPDLTVFGHVHRFGQFLGIGAVQLQLIHGIVHKIENRVGFGQHGRAGIEGVRAAGPTDPHLAGAGRRTGRSSIGRGSFFTRAGRSSGRAAAGSKQRDRCQQKNRQPNPLGHAFPPL